MVLAAAVSDRSSTPIDRLFQLGYVMAYRTMRMYWRVRHPITHGTLVAIWHDGQVLLVRNSYLPYYSAPGGYVRSHEDARAAAVRELAEEVGARVEPERLTFTLEVEHEWEHKRDHVTIFRLELAERPRIQVDHREVVEARWCSPAEVRALDVFPPLKQAIEARS